MKNIRIRLIGVASAAVISACTGGDDETNSNATAIDTPAAGAKYVAAAVDFVDLGDSINAKSTSSSQNRSKRLVRAKSVVTNDCGVRGSYTYDSSSGRYEYQDCVYEYQGASESYRATDTINGVQYYQCAESVGGGSSSEKDCMGEYLDTYGENGVPITIEFEDTNGDNDYSADLYTDRYSVFDLANNDGYGFDSLYNGTSSYQDRTAMAKAATLTFTNFRVIESYHSGGGYEEYNISGTLGSDLGDVIDGCPTGSATYNTVVPIAITDGTLTAGELTITNENGDTAHLVVDDGEFLITVNGVSESFSASELEDICD